jgi:hypothetical protein
MRGAIGLGHCWLGGRRIVWSQDITEAVVATQTTMSIFRARDIALARMFEAGMTSGAVVKRLFDAPGFSLLYAWFKPSFPLYRHSHDKDCLYYIVSGSLRLGTEDLGPGDGFFLTADTPYTYSIGPDGLEILEFRHEGDFNTRTMGGTKAYWDKAVAAITANRSTWEAMVPPRAAA